MLGDTCGTVTAAYMLIGLKYGIDKPGQFEEALSSGRMMSFCPVLASDVIDILKEIL